MLSPGHMAAQRGGDARSSNRSVATTAPAATVAGSDDGSSWNIAGFIFTASTLVWHLGCFFREANNAPTEEIRDFWITVLRLRESVRRTRDILQTRTSPSPVELKNHICIKRIVSKCRAELAQIQRRLPLPGAEGVALADQEGQITLVLSQAAAGDAYQAMELCDTALEVEQKLMDIFIMNPSQRAFQRKGVQDRLKEVIREGGQLVSYRGFNKMDLEWDAVLVEFIQSVQDAALEPPMARSTSMDGGADVDSGISVNFDGDEDEAIASSMPEGVIEARSVPTMLVQAKAFMDAGKYKEAARIQKRAISRRVMMSLQMPFGIQERCEMEMRLAEIFRKMGNPKSLQLSAGILGRLREGVREALEAESSENGDQQQQTNDDDVRARRIFLLSYICYDLGRTCIELENIDAACEALNESFEILAEIRPPPVDELRRSGTILYRLLLGLDNPNVSILGRYAAEAFGVPLLELAWCQSRGFDINKSDFGFDKTYDNIDGLSPLHMAAKQGADDVLRFMLESDGLAIDVRDKLDHMTPFLMACAQQDIVIVDMLLAAGARPDARDGDDKTGLMLCQRSEGGTQVARRLLTAMHPDGPGLAVDVNAMDRFQNTALHLAASKGNIPMVSLLLSHGAEPDILGPGAFTPLMAAVEATMKSQAIKVGVIEELIRRGADPTRQDMRGLTAADLANDLQVQKLLQKAMKQFQKKSPKQFPLSPRRFSKWVGSSAS